MHKAIRYIGSKQKLLSFLEDNLFYLLKKNDSFFEGFAGTGIVSQYIFEKKLNITISGGDISKYSQILFEIINIQKYFKNNEEILNIFEEFENKQKIISHIYNEFSNQGNPFNFTEARNFFHFNTAKDIDSFKEFLNEKLKKNKLTKKQVDILLFFLLSYTCKNANTTSVFGAYLKTPAKYKEFNKEFINKILNDINLFFDKKNNPNNIFYYGDIIENLKKIPKQNMIYLDPPYSTRKYESNYHILNYVVDLDFSPDMIKENSKTAQPKNTIQNSFGKKSETQKIFNKMILLAIDKTDILAISYNSDGIIKQNFIQELCEKNNLKLDTKILKYKRFKSNNLLNKNKNELQEILWIITKK